MPSRSEPRAVVTVDLSPFTTDSDDSQKLHAGQTLVDALHKYGFAKVVGHGTKEEIREALNWTKMLFDLPYSEKMKAPHPKGPIPHRGYSGIGQEKVYSQADVEKHSSSNGNGNSDGNGNVRDAIRKISDFKESFEIGREGDTEQQNIWLPEDVLPNFRPYMVALSARLEGVSKVVLEAIGVGLGLDGEEHAALMALQQDYQLRLLHYPAITREKVQNELMARLPEHHDWGTITLLFQDERGGLELQDPHTHDFLGAEPEEGAFVLNVGDMLQRFTNDYFVSALHRVSVPSPDNLPESGILPARYSIPFFVAPSSSHVVATLPRFVTAETPAKYEPVRFDEYGAIISKYQYQD